MGLPTPYAGSIVTQPWLETEVHDLWTLSSEELALLPGMTDKGRLGFALQLKFMQIHGRFPEQHTEIDPNSTQWIARQLDGRQGRRHRQAIRRVLGFRPATAADFERLGHWLRAEALPYDPQAQHGTDSALESCRTQRLEPPAPEHLGRIIRSAVHRFETHHQEGISARLSDASRAAIDELLATDEPESPTPEPDGKDSV
jgi:hypothetical protein